MRTTVLLILSLFVFACQQKYLSKPQLVNYIQSENHGLKKSLARGPLSFTVIYRPTDLLVDQEVVDLGDTARVAEAMNKYDQYLYFVLQMSNQGRELLGSSPQYSVAEYITKISFGMQPHTRLTTISQDTIPVSDYIYSRTFGYGSSTDLLFVFDREKALQQEKLYFNLDEFGLGTGNMRFEFRKEDILSTPKLSELKDYYDI